MFYRLRVSQSSYVERGEGVIHPRPQDFFFQDLEKLMAFSRRRLEDTDVTGISVEVMDFYDEMENYHDP